MTQCAQILSALQVGPLTPLDALHQFGCFRLAARVAELRQAGHHIVTETVNAGGKSFASYRLIRAEQKELAI